MEIKNMDDDAAGEEKVLRLEGNSANYGKRQTYVWSEWNCGVWQLKQRVQLMGLGCLGCLGCTFRHVRGPSKDFHVVWPPPRVAFCVETGDGSGKHASPRILPCAFLTLFSPMVCRKISEGQRLGQWLAKGNKT